MVELLNKSTLQVRKSEKVYNLWCDSDCTLGELYDSVCDIQAYVIDRIQKSAPKQEDKPEVLEPKIEVLQPEVE